MLDSKILFTESQNANITFELCPDQTDSTTCLLGVTTHIQALSFGLVGSSFVHKTYRKVNFSNTICHRLDTYHLKTSLLGGFACRPLKPKTGSISNTGGTPKIKSISI